MSPESNRPAPLEFSRRAHLDEWMDEPCSYADFRDCLRDLEEVNRVTFAYRPTMTWLAQFAAPLDRPLRIVDVGCGGGGMLRHIERWAAARSLPVTLTGIDLNPFAARAAREFTPAASCIEWITGDAFSLRRDEPADLVISSLFTHHLPDAEIVRFLQWMETTARRGWFINDLHREALPYYAFGLLAKLARWHRFVQHDGPVSIRRAFRVADWKAYLQEAAMTHVPVQVVPVRPARLCVSRVKA